MRIITGNNKTTDLIKIADSKPILIVCHSREECHRILKYSKNIGANIHLPITYEDMIEGRYSQRNIKSLLLDNVEMFLEYISRGKIEAITIGDEFIGNMNMNQ